MRKRTYQRSVLCMPTDPAILGYAAGLLDGEGSITIRTARLKRSPANQYHNIQLTISVTDPMLAVWLYTRFGGLTATRKRGRPNWKPLHDWYVSGGQVAGFLVGVLPYLVIKRAQAEVALEFCRTALGPRTRLRGWCLPQAIQVQREQLRLRMRGLNARGLRVVGE